MEKKKTVNVLGQEVEEEKLKGILKDVLKVRGVSGQITLDLKEGKAPKGSDKAFYKYAFFDCIG